MVALPTTGCFISTSQGAAIPVFYCFDVPALFAVSEATRDLAIEIHHYLGYGVLVLAGGRAGAALL